MSDSLVERAEKVKKAVEQGKESFTATKTEYTLNQKLLNETLAEIKTKYGLNSYEELQAAVKNLGEKITTNLGEIEELLAAANIPLSEVPSHEV